MENVGVVVVEPVGPNPHYRPPIMRWNRVEVLGVRGMEIGVVADTRGDLTIAVRLSGGRWPLGQEPESGSVHLLGGRGDDFVYVVRNDERGPAVGHELEPDGQGGCKVCTRMGIIPP